MTRGCSQHYGMRLVISTVMSPLLFTIVFFYEQYLLNVFSFAVVIDEGADAVGCFTNLKLRNHNSHEYNITVVIA